LNTSGLVVSWNVFEDAKLKGSLVMPFDDANGGRVELLRKDDSLSVIGQIEYATRLWVRLAHCELDE